MKPPIWKRTWELFKRLREFEGLGKVAQLCGKEIQTVDAWARPPESDEYPTGTGRHNTFDCSLRVIRYAFTKDPALAREMAEVFPEYVSFLEENAGRSYARSGGDLLTLLANSVSEHADILKEAVKKDVDVDRLFTEYKEFQCVMNQFEAALKESMKQMIKDTAVVKTQRRFAA